MKKSYTLLITIVLITIFAYLSSLILETKALKSQNLRNQYLYIQAKNHKNFLKEYLETLDLKSFNEIEIEIEDEFFLIHAIKSQDLKSMNLYIKSKEFDIRITEKILIK